jgi:hypothetical protein
MKTILLLLASISYGQNLIIDQNTTLGTSCGNGQQEVFTFQDVNFNGNFTLTLKNAKLVINGNLNGTGTIKNQCNNNESEVIVNGYTNGNITYVNFTLSTPAFNHTLNLDLPYTIYSIDGRIQRFGRTSVNMYDELQPNTIYIVKVEGFKMFKKVK